jgi:hypothetical protein
MLLSKLQKRELARLAHQAWLRLPERAALIAGNPELSASGMETAWRHTEQGKAMGGVRQSLTVATQRDYLILRAHFQRLCGMEAAANKALAQAATDGARRALFLLRAALGRCGLSEAYASKICRTQYRCELGEATEKQLWSVIFTIKNRRKVAAKSPGGTSSGAGKEGL